MDAGRQLILLRHAKSDWGDATLPDESRPLAPRGRRATTLIRQYLRGHDVRVDLVLCSPATRTRQTWAGIKDGLRAAPEFRLVPEIYEASTRDLLDVLHESDGARSVMLIGHNPGIEDLASALVNEVIGFPTGAMARLTFDGDWADLQRGTARLAGYVTPRELGGGGP